MHDQKREDGERHGDHDCQSHGTILVMFSIGAARLHAAITNEPATWFRRSPSPAASNSELELDGAPNGYSSYLDEREHVSVRLARAGCHFDRLAALHVL